MHLLRTIIGALLIAGAFAMPIMAQQSGDPAGLGGLAGQAGAEVNISANSLEIIEESNTALFQGDVVINQGTMEMRAQRVEALYGEGGPSDLVSFVASGGRVTMTFDDQTVEGDQANYDFAQRVLTFSGDVEVINPSGRVTSARLVIDTRAGTSSFSGTGGSGGRVTGVFTPGG